MATASASWPRPASKSIKAVTKPTSLSARACIARSPVDAPRAAASAAAEKTRPKSAAYTLTWPRPQSALARTTSATSAASLAWSARSYQPMASRRYPRCCQNRVSAERTAAPEQSALRVGEKGVAPFDRRSEGLLPWDGRTTPARQETEPIVHGRRDLLGRQHPRPRRGELERQRDAVETEANLGNGGCSFVAHLKVRPRPPCSVDEESHSLVLPECGNGLRFSVRRCRERWHPPGALAVDVEGFATRGQHGEVGTRPEQGLGNRRTRAQQMFAVVETHECIGVGEVFDHAIAGRAGGVVLDAKSRERRRTDQVGVPQRRKVDPPHTVRILVERLGCGVQGKTGLARPTGPSDSDQS